jgi:hypothetical protein
MKLVMEGIAADDGAGAPGAGTNGFKGLLAEGVVRPGIGSLGREGKGGRLGTGAAGPGRVGTTAFVAGTAALGLITTLVLPSTASRRASSIRGSRLVEATFGSWNTGAFCAWLPSAIAKQRR